MRKTLLLTLGFLIGFAFGGFNDSALAQSVGPSGGLQIEGLSGAQAIPMSASSLPLPAGAAVESGGNLAKVASAVQTTGSAIPSASLLHGCSDGTSQRAMACDAAGNATMTGTGVAGTPATGVLSIQGITGGTALPISGVLTLAQATRHDFGPTLASGATQLTTGAGTLLSAAATTAAALGANLCFYDGNPATSGTLISAFNVATGSIGAFSASQSGIPYSNGLWVRASSVLASCTSLGTSLSLGFGNVVTLP